MKILTTLAENDYFMGVAALVNSVVKHGTYVDRVIIGYRGQLPNWLPKLVNSKHGKSCTLKSGLELELVLLDSDLHMVHEKPKWFKHLARVIEPDANEYFFFDSDIVVINRMSFFGDWVKEGVALCEDVNFDMSSNHPVRQQWIKLAEEDGIEIKRIIERYYNSGFLGWSNKTIDFIDDWERCFRTLSRKSGDMKKFRVHDRTNTVLSANQDSLNLAAMTTSAPLSTIGPDAMGFKNGIHLMSHPIGPKPWRRKFFKEYVRGSPPRNSDVLFWEYVNGTEFQPISSSITKRKQLLCKVLRGGARFYKSNSLS
ncbi:hypothetical protein PKOR_13805 [Pontibacter korlensis]|uniref:Nucleotide-diphospho-sugar transferase domain-containing protein n=1 Tax=Pontibacter korlensis TaxID=400092 RepID=A0A0E3UX65_9BACT|nr:hypothetical protein [Pontibacter korlensis]AKD03977.1 hypothetical protein PKOR_13805 [Pontibacter korlensis]